MKLPLDCDLEYHKSFLSEGESSALFEWICQNCDVLEFHRVVLADGSTHTTNIGKQMFVDPELTDHSLLHETHGKRMVWPPPIAALRDRVEKLTGTEFNVCVCVYYPDGDSGITFHSDFPSFGSVSVIPSLSIGAKRRFLLRNRHDHSETLSLDLENGSLLIMGDGCQEMYEHSLPVDPDSRDPRINLSFRQFDWPPQIERAPR